MKDPRTNPHQTQGKKSLSDPRSKRVKARTVPNDKKSASKAPPPDPIDLTDRSALIKFVQAEAKRIPDIRQDRVDQIRAALQSGEIITFPVISSRTESFKTSFWMNPRHKTKLQSRLIV